MDRATIRGDFDAIARLSGEEVDRTGRFDDFVLALVPAEARSVLDVGCGGGALARWLARAGRRVAGVDLSPEMIARARRRAVGHAGLTFHCADFLEHDFGEQFDCVVTMTTLHHVPLEQGIERLVTLVRPGGRLVIHDLRRNDGLADIVRSHASLAFGVSQRLLRTGRLMPPKAIRDAWARHGAGETYPTFSEAQAMAARFLPGSQVHYHWAWRYTVVWDKVSR